MVLPTVYVLIDILSITQNEPYAPSYARRTAGQKEGAYEGENAGLTGVLGEEVAYSGSQGKFSKEAALEELVNEDTVHPNSST